ncbi:MAG TPA: heme peroxidase family protein [Ktedonobacterales bacterium]|jgi:hypothetical protein|nr:heme peroxidase family protein [Ktedonobacterales bacterium]
MAARIAHAKTVASHSCVLAPHLKHAFSVAAGEKYGRMFPDLAACDANEEELIRLGRAGEVMDVASGPEADALETDNPRIPAGYTILGQFIAHDITADRSLLHHHTNLDEIRNVRTPCLDLECLYGSGPTGTPYLYDTGDTDKFLLGVNDKGEPRDVPRNQQGVALVGDPRNDVHQPISQLHLAFLMFHNAVVDHLRAEGVADVSTFSETQRLVRWHYQWIVLHEFLPLTAGDELVKDISENGLRYYRWEQRPFIPVEFADAAYRFAHSQVRTTYRLNEHASGQIFPECAGACPVPSAHALDWRYFFQLDPDQPPQPSKKIDTQLAHALIDLPTTVVGSTEIPEHHSLAVRDLLRGHALDLPSGEAVAATMGVEPLPADELGLRELGWQGETPLWYYVLREAQVRERGERLGPVGGRIVAEVLIGLIAADANSYPAVEPDWHPTLPAQREGQFTMADLLRFSTATPLQSTS